MRRRRSRPASSTAWWRTAWPASPSLWRRATSLSPPRRARAAPATPLPSASCPRFAVGCSAKAPGQARLRSQRCRRWRRRCACRSAASPERSSRSPRASPPRPRGERSNTPGRRRMRWTKRWRRRRSTPSPSPGGSPGRSGARRSTCWTRAPPRHRSITPLVAYGFAGGPFAEADRLGFGSVFSLTGQDIALDEAWRTYSPTLDFMLDAGRTGGSQHPGWFRRGEGDASQFDPEVERILTASAMFQGLHRRREGDAALERRCLQAMISGSLDLLDICSALGWREVDALWTRRLGFPRWRGGPAVSGRAYGLACGARRDRGPGADPGPSVRAAARLGRGPAPSPAGGVATPAGFIQIDFKRDRLIPATGEADPLRTLLFPRICCRAQSAVVSSENAVLWMPARRAGKKDEEDVAASGQFNRSSWRMPGLADEIRSLPLKVVASTPRRRGRPRRRLPACRSPPGGQRRGCGWRWRRRPWLWPCGRHSWAAGWRPARPR